MNGVLLFILGAVVGAIVLMVASCISVGSEKDSYNNQSFNRFNKSTGILFTTLVYCLSDRLGKETTVNFIINAVKIGINKNLIEFTQDDVQIDDFAESLYEAVIEAIEGEDD